MLSSGASSFFRRCVLTSTLYCPVSVFHSHTALPRESNVGLPELFVDAGSLSVGSFEIGGKTRGGIPLTVLIDTIFGSSPAGWFRNLLTAYRHCDPIRAGKNLITHSCACRSVTQPTHCRHSVLP
jgi:hypothetical protein